MHACMPLIREIMICVLRSRAARAHSSTSRSLPSLFQPPSSRSLITMGNPINDFLRKYDVDVNELLTFRLEKTVTIQVWQVGLFYRLSQLLVVIYVGVGMHYANTWAYTEAPMGTVNAWPENGDFAAPASLNDFGVLPYCENASFSYAYDASFNMDLPACEVQHPYEITTKEPGQLIFTTAFIEVGEVGWECADTTADAAQRQACTARGGSARARSSSQCICETTRTVYPVGVDRSACRAIEVSARPPKQARLRDLMVDLSWTKQCPWPSSTPLPPRRPTLSLGASRHRATKCPTQPTVSVASKATCACRRGHIHQRLDLISLVRSCS